MFINSINPIIKLTETCNYNCGFCRYAHHRRNDHGISEELIMKMINESIDYNVGHGIEKINIIFHGGEPLLYGVNRLSTILDAVTTVAAEKKIIIDFSLQTNASLVTKEWIEVFKKYNFDIGISLDGPNELNEHGKEQGDLAVKNAIQIYHTLRENGVRCGILSVITNKHLDYMKQFFDFFVENRIDSVSLCYCYGKNDENNVNPIILGERLIELYELYYNSSSKIRIREFDNAIKRIVARVRDKKEFVCRNNCGRYLTLIPNGEIEFCDDYYCDTKSDLLLGNIKEMSISDIVTGAVYNEIRSEVFHIVENKCLNCNVRYICRGGCARNDINHENYFCATYKIIYPYIEQKVISYLETRCRNRTLY